MLWAASLRVGKTLCPGCSGCDDAFARVSTGCRVAVGRQGPQAGGEVTSVGISAGHAPVLGPEVRLSLGLFPRWLLPSSLSPLDIRANVVRAWGQGPQGCRAVEAEQGKQGTGDPGVGKGRATEDLGRRLIMATSEDPATWTRVMARRRGDPGSLLFACPVISLVGQEASWQEP